MPSKQTKRERKELARQRKLEEMKAAARRRKMQKVTSFLTLIAVAAGIYGIVWLTGRGGRQALAQVNELTAAAGCTEVTEPEYRGKDHISPPATGDYSSDPPTSGSHYATATAPTRTGVHTDPIPNESQVHNLEHGHIGLQYNASLPEEIKEELEAIARDNEDWVFTAPRPELAPQLAMTAWRKLVTCDAPADKDAVIAVANAFVREFQQGAPEEFPG